MQSPASPAASPARSRTLAHLAMLLYALLIAGSFSFGAVAAPHLDPAALNAVRFVGAAVLMGALYLADPRASRRVPPALWRFAVLGGLMAVYFVLMFVALRITDPVSTSAVFTLIPLMAAGFGYVVLAQRTGGIVWLSLVIAAVGALWVIFRADPARLLAFEIGRGEAIFFLGCACQALYAPLVRRLNRGESVFEFTVWTIAACALGLTVVALPQIVATDWAALDMTVWLAIAYLAIGSSALSFLLLQYASINLPAAKVFPYAYLIPSIVILLEAAMGNGWANPIVAVGALITAIGLAIMIMAKDE